MAPACSSGFRLRVTSNEYRVMSAWVNGAPGYLDAGDMWCPEANLLQTGCSRLPGSSPTTPNSSPSLITRHSPLIHLPQSSLPVLGKSQGSSGVPPGWHVAVLPCFRNAGGAPVCALGLRPGWRPGLKRAVRGRESTYSGLWQSDELHPAVFGEGAGHREHGRGRAGFSGLEHRSFRRAPALWHLGHPRALWPGQSRGRLAVISSFSKRRVIRFSCPLPPSSTSKSSFKAKSGVIS